MVHIGGEKVTACVSLTACSLTVSTDGDARYYYRSALALAEQAHVLAEKATNKSMLALADNILGMLARSRGELATAVAFL